MKKILTAAVAFMLLGASASAQSKEGQKHREDGQKHKMHQELGLTADQKAEMKRIKDAEKTELEALKKDTKLSKEESVAARKAIHEKYKSQFKNVLTEEQQKKAAEMRKHDGDGAKRMKRDSSFRDKGAAPRNAKAKHRGELVNGEPKKKAGEEMTLTAEQKTRMAASREEFKAQAEAIKKNDKLTKEQKQAEMKKLGEKQREEFKSLLTEEQKKKLESKSKGEMRKNK